MIFSALLTLAFVAVTTANPIHTEIYTRTVSIRQASDSTSMDIPPACSSQCTTFSAIYYQCASGTTECLAICKPTTWNEFVGCLNCLVISEKPDQIGISALERSLTILSTACAEAGGAPTGTIAFVGAATATPSVVSSASQSLSTVSTVSSVRPSSSVIPSGSSAASPSQASSSTSSAYSTTVLSTTVAFAAFFVVLYLA